MLQIIAFIKALRHFVISKQLYATCYVHNMFKILDFLNVLKLVKNGFYSRENPSTP